MNPSSCTPPIRPLLQIKSMDTPHCLYTDRLTACAEQLGDPKLRICERAGPKALTGQHMAHDQRECVMWDFTLQTRFPYLHLWMWLKAHGPSILTMCHIAWHYIRPSNSSHSLWSSRDSGGRHSSPTSSSPLPSTSCSLPPSPPSCWSGRGVRHRLLLLHRGSHHIYIPGSPLPSAHMC